MAARTEDRESRVLWRFAAPYRGAMIGLALLSLAGALLEAGFLVLLTAALLSLVAGATNELTVRGITVSMGTVLLVAALAVALRLVLGLLSVRVSAGLAARVTVAQRRRLANAYLKTAWSVQQAEPSGRLQELLTSFVGRATTAMTALTQGITAALSLVAFLAAGLVVDAMATLAVLGALVALSLVLSPLRRGIRKRAATNAQDSIAFTKTVAELGTLGQEMQTFGVRAQFASRIDALTQASTASARRVQQLHGALTPVYTALAYGAVVAGIGILTTVGVGDLAAVGAVMLLMLRSLSYGQQLLAVSGTLASAIPFLERLEASVADYESRQASSGSTQPQDVLPIHFTDVTYQYAADRAALADLNVRVAPGEMIGVIGPSGAGKSTFAQLILGLREPTAGVVAVHGVSLSEVDRAWWNDKVAFVPQEPRLLTGTVAENIRFFRSGISDEDLRRSATQAHILADIEKLPFGFDTHLGERGGQLSGGQRQRLSIARALAGKPSLLVLDEPTSALDGRSEGLIRDTLAELNREVTVVIIAHRMSTLDLCERLLVIQEGQVTGLGAPSELRRSNAFYRQALVVANLA